ncbi:hypothetical protein PF005_g26108 [Phytophthora fragariae]|uniref:Uncharacterized protein n=1 Tax=Phytophthora fragariae TaxID=53985 RepID=A0A6A3DX76_9STRA|nr:hypothetical protein PF009_g25225 [Phytophthora fragariae]KAE9095836.1 hypothetical protein PF007_g17238 [Phytophthora fragariae]KAE9096129.1 hypothetical protein PF006_g23850 [Phytophthora fragariae]KAE9173838.1 hypothetical protein PF005_g26108 [Phytophthora fragariae]KAE9193665.1 hypothetical protein PF002_g23835 [Phytophthora fragariae]
MVPLTWILSPSISCSCFSSLFFSSQSSLGAIPTHTTQHTKVTPVPGRGTSCRVGKHDFTSPRPSY